MNVDVCRPANGSVTAGNDSFDVTSVGQFLAPAPGVLDNDNSPNGNRGGTALTATLISNVPNTAGHVVLSPNGAFNFSPVANWVGNATFTYSATDGAGAANATVTLTRLVAPTVLTFNNGKWTINGVRATGAGSCSRVTAVLDRTGQQIGRVSNLGNSTTWSITATAPAFLANDTVTITADQCGGGGGGGSFVLAALLVNANLATNEALTTAFVQCPGDTNGNGVIDEAEQPVGGPRRVCKHLAAGDGYINMADGSELYTFGFNDVTASRPTRRSRRAS